MNMIHIPEEIRSEFSVDADGKTFASRRAVARLCGLKDHSPITNLLKNVGGGKNVSETLESFAGQSFEGGGKLPDILVSAIISHYSLKGRQEATRTLIAFAAIGIRTWIQQELGWQLPEPRQAYLPNCPEIYESLLPHLKMDSLFYAFNHFQLKHSDLYLKHRSPELEHRHRVNNLQST